ncbi:MAG: hypothetical protein ACP5HJ_03335 [Candidatus Micrarchaeia archaeon]
MNIEIALAILTASFAWIFTNSNNKTDRFFFKYLFLFFLLASTAYFQLLDYNVRYLVVLSVIILIIVLASDLISFMLNVFGKFA